MEKVWECETGKWVGGRHIIQRDGVVGRGVGGGGGRGVHVVRDRPLAARYCSVKPTGPWF